MNKSIMSLYTNEKDENQKYIFKKFFAKKIENLSFKHGLNDVLIEKDKALEELDFIDNINEKD